MRAKMIDDATGYRTFVVVLETGDEVMAALQDFVAGEHLKSADWERKTTNASL